MAIPSTVPNTAAGYLEYLGDQIRKADKLWSEYAEVVGGAYLDAYTANMDVLKQIKEAKNARQKADEANMAFALSLLTVGVGGCIAGAVARSITESKTYQDGWKQVVQLAQRQAVAPVVETVSGALSPDKAGGDAFAPSDITPAKYTSNLKIGIKYTVALLTQLIVDTKWDPDLKSLNYEGKDIQLRRGGPGPGSSPGNGLSTEGMKLLTEEIMKSSFMTEMPPLNLDQDMLTRKASLALWIGWAYGRDAKYWKRAKDDPAHVRPAGRVGFGKTGDDAAWEQLDWEPVRRALVGLGVPETAITVETQLPVISFAAKVSTAKGLYFWGFLEWAASRHSTELLFDKKLPRNAKGFETVVKRKMRKWLSDDGWVYDPA